MSTAALLEPRPAAAVSSAPVVSSSELAELIGAFNEVTLRLERTHKTLTAQVARLEDELRDSREQLRRARHLAALGEMAAGIAHEVRNPLGSIGLYAQVLWDDLAARPELRDVAGKIARAVRGLDMVVSDVLLFARQRAPEMAPVRASDLTRDALAACHDVLEKSGIVVMPARSRGLLVHADAGLMHQALVNVIRNAAEAMADNPPDHPRVLELGEIRRSLVGVSGASEPMSGISLRDSGPGFEAEAARRMFDPFYTTKATGTGLGLAIVHRIVDAHGGRIIVRNNKAPERGATVELLVPRRDTDGEA